MTRCLQGGELVALPNMLVVGIYSTAVVSTAWKKTIVIITIIMFIATILKLSIYTPALWVSD